MSSILKAVKFSSSTGFFGKSKHKKLAEEWGEGTGNKEPVCDGITFYVKYLGSTLVEKPNDQQLTAEAIKTIISMAKASGKKLKRVAMKITPTGITTFDIVSGQKHVDFCIYRISYCSADAAYERVVAFISTNSNETLECHAFLCSKRKVAEAAALTISQAFSIAFELWEQAREESAAESIKENHENFNENETQPENIINSGFKSSGLECALIDLKDGDSACNTMKKLGLSLDSNLNDSFSKLAESRNHPILATNVSSEVLDDISHLVQLQDKDPFMQDQVDDLLLL